MEQVCCVCGEEVDPEHVSRCSFCGGYFHMAWSVHVDMKECGRYVLNEQCCAMMFLCANCAAKAPAPSNQEAPEGPI